MKNPKDINEYKLVSKVCNIFNHEKKYTHHAYQCEIAKL